LIDSIAIGLGAMIGAGVFVVIGVAAGVAGPALLIGLSLAAVTATCNALSSAQLAASYPQAGGTYEYGYRVLHPAMGFAAGWMFLVSKLAAGGTVAIGFGSYFARLVPAVSPREAAVAAALLLTLANLAGIRKAGRLNTVIVCATVLTLVVFILATAPVFDAGNMTPFAPGGGASAFQAAGLMFFAYTGYARLATLAEEVRDPARTIPRAIGWAVGGTTVLYLLVAGSALGAVGAAAMAETTAPLERAAQASPVPGLPTVVLLGGALAMLGVLLSGLLGISRMMFAMARRGDFLGVFARVHEPTGVPVAGVLLSGAVVVLLALFGTLQAVVAAASFTILLYYSIANIAALRMPRGKKLFPDLVPGLGLLTCLVLAGSLPRDTMVSGIGLLVVGFAVRFVFRMTPYRGTM
jgi:basic amino acid/polyamine antiporter, APA family